MRIKGTNKSDVLLASAGSDVVQGGRGNDWLEGGAGDDMITGGEGADRFVLRSGDGHDVVTDFDPTLGDRVLFDYGTYSDVMFLGTLSDGLTWTNSTGTGTFTVSEVDYNGDGKADTMITANNDSIVLLGWAPEALMGWALMGG